MDMGVVPQGLFPRVKNTYDAGFEASELLVLEQIAHRLIYGAKHHTVDELLVCISQRIQLRGNGEHDVIVCHTRNHFGPPLVNP